MKFLTYLSKILKPIKKGTQITITILIDSKFNVTEKGPHKITIPFEKVK